MKNSNAELFQGPVSRLLPLLEEAGVTDVLVNGAESCFVEKAGVLEPREPPFAREEEMWEAVERLLSHLGKRRDRRHPFVDGYLPDGSRIHFLFPPLISWPVLSIRRFAAREEVSLASFGPPSVVEWLQQTVSARCNLIIAGGTGSGKTTLLGLLLDRVPGEQRIITIEEAAEIKTIHPHRIALQTLAPGPENTDAIGTEQLIREALRMRPDRLVIGECRGPESFSMLQAMTTGHPGSMSTVHANGSKEALLRLELLTAWGCPRAVSPLFPRQWLSQAVEFVIFLRREGKTRSIKEVVQLCGLEGEQYRFRPLYDKSNNYNDLATLLVVFLNLCHIVAL